MTEILVLILFLLLIAAINVGICLWLIYLLAAFYNDDSD